jgi:hypothetical protein
MSTSSDLLLELSTGSSTEYYRYMVGFRAKYEFVLGLAALCFHVSVVDLFLTVPVWSEMLGADCDQYLYDLGGGYIDLPKLTETCPITKYFDCIWVIWRYEAFTAHNILSLRIEDWSLSGQLQ